MVTICVMLCVTLSFFFSSFVHQTAGESTEISCPHGIQQSVMVVTEYYDPANKPSPRFCSMLACARSGRNCGILLSTVII